MHVTVSSCTNHISRYICHQGPGFQEMEACSLLVNLRKGMQSSSEQPLVGEERYVMTLITAAKETSCAVVRFCYHSYDYRPNWIPLSPITIT